MMSERKAAPVLCDLDSEVAFLGTILSNPSSMAEAASALPHAMPLYPRTHQLIYQVMLDLFHRGVAFDGVLVLTEATSRAGEQNGLATLVHGLVMSGTTPAAIPHHAERIIDLWRRRSLVEIGHRLRISAEEQDATTTVSKLLTDLGHVTQFADTRWTLDGKDLVPLVLDDLDAVRKGTKKIGLKTGFIDLDDFLKGVDGDELITLAARSSQGKTTLLLNLLANVCYRQGKNGLLFSIEMNSRDVARRIVSAETGINLHKIRTGSTTFDEDKRIVALEAVLAKGGNLRVIDRPALTMLDVRTELVRMLHTGPVGLVAIDYLGLMQLARAERREREVAEAVWQMKTLARELHVPIVNVVQLLRSADECDRPELRHLRESGDIENHSDFVLLLHRWDDKFNAGAQHYELSVEKARNAPIGRVALMFEKDCVRFRDATMEEKDEMFKRTGS